MKRFSAYILILLLSGLNAQALEIVYPKSDKVTINSDATFFIGNENPERELFINSERVNIHPSGGFIHPVKLNIGQNEFKVGNLKYTITRNAKADYDLLVQEVLYEQPVMYITAKDGAPLRSTPYDNGINRLQHLEKAVPLKIVGEYAGYYKAQLARDDYVWVQKTDVIKSENLDDSISKIESFEYLELPDKRVFNLKLTKKTPYILSESNGLDLVVYNVKGYPENKYEFHINSVGKLFGYKSYYKNNHELVIEVKNPPSVDKNMPLKGLNITIDPGHGGGEAGAIGCLGDKEKNVNLQFALKLREVLLKAGANVYMTRRDDTTVSLSERVKFSQNHNSDVFVSIHNNALPDSLAFSGRSGSSVFYFYPQSKALGASILKFLVATGMKDDKLRRESFAVIRNSDSLSVLVEVGYMINPEDNARITDENYRQKAAEAIKQGMENYFNGI